MKYIIIIVFALFSLSILSCNSSKKSRKKRNSSSSYSNNKSTSKSSSKAINSTSKNSPSKNSSSGVSNQNNTSYEENINLGSTDNYFKVIKATSLKSVGGVPGAGTNTRYTINIRLTENADIKLLDLWVGGNKSIPLTSYKPKVNTAGSETEYIANLKYLPEYMLEKIRQNGEPLPPEGKPAPKQFSGSALISYQVNGAIEYKEISKISKQATQYMP